MNNPLAALTDQFLNERTCLKNVTPSTLLWYQVAFKNYRRAMGDAAAPLPTKITLQEFVIKQRERGLRPVTGQHLHWCDDAFCAWLPSGGPHIGERAKLSNLRV